jgi:hypothetical protein
MLVQLIDCYGLSGFLGEGRNFGNQTVPRSDCLTIGVQAQFNFFVAYYKTKNLHQISKRLAVRWKKALTEQSFDTNCNT